MINSDISSVGMITMRSSTISFDTGATVASKVMSSEPVFARLEFEVPLKVAAHPERSFIKRSTDVILALYSLIVCAPVLCCVAILIKLDSRGPVLFSQQRVGLNGRVFRCLKFRTMAVDAEAPLNEMESRSELAGMILFRVQRDPRITHIGRILRRTGLDNLPQLWNVLVGQMSLVGPRPLPLRHIVQLKTHFPTLIERRLSVMPGITGPWQALWSNKFDSVKMIQMDMEYIEQWSLWRDFLVVIKSVGYGSRRVVEFLHEYTTDISSLHSTAVRSSRVETDAKCFHQRASKSSFKNNYLSRHPSYHREAGRFSYIFGLAGALLFMASGLGPGWVGFALAFLPASLLAAWAVTDNA